LTKSARCKINNFSNSSLGGGASLFPAHFLKNDADAEWLLDAERRNEKAASDTTETLGGTASTTEAKLFTKDNIMSPVLRSTSADYWLDRKDQEFMSIDNGEARPSVAERGPVQHISQLSDFFYVSLSPLVPDPLLSLWLASTNRLSVSATTNRATGESSPKKARFEWPENITNSTAANWLIDSSANDALTTKNTRIQWPEHIMDCVVDNWLECNTADAFAARKEVATSTPVIGGGGRIKWPKLIIETGLNNWIVGGGDDNSNEHNAATNSGCRIEWPRELTESGLNNWLVAVNDNDGFHKSGGAGWPGEQITDVDSWLAKSKKDDEGEKLLNETTETHDRWLANEVNRNPSPVLTNSSVDAWLTLAMNEFNLSDTGDAESSILVLDDETDFDIVSHVEDEDENSVDLELAKWLVIN
jgi:hypothetical protein